jgi:hypothetical protein
MKDVLFGGCVINVCVSAEEGRQGQKTKRGKRGEVRDEEKGREE